MSPTEAWATLVGWMVASRESAALAEVLIRQTVAKQGIVADQLTIHANRGSSMTSKPVAFLLADSASSSRTAARTSDDQPVLRRPVQDPEVPARLPQPVHRFRSTAVALTDP